VRQRLSLLPGTGAHAGQCAQDAEIFHCTQFVLQRIVVSDINEVLPEFLAQGADVHALPAYFTGGGQQQSAQRAQQAGLATAVRARDQQQRAEVQREVEVAEQPAVAAGDFDFMGFKHGG